MPLKLKQSDVRFIRKLLKQHNFALIFVVAVVFLGLGLWLGNEAEVNTGDDSAIAPESAIERSGPHEVVHVIDGDTIRVRVNEEVEPVRLIGIDTPEVDSPYTELECYGEEASIRAQKLLEGEFVYLESDETQDNRDQHDRLLRYVILEDETNVNQLLVEEGYAHEYTFREAYRYQGEFIQAQQDARDNQRGLWADDTCGGYVVPLPEGISSDQEVSVGAKPGCISYEQAPNHVGVDTCVTGRVDHVFVSGSNTTFINYCEDYRNCPFSAVLFDGDRSRFSAVGELSGKVITIDGVIRTHEGRPQIILRDPSQIR